MPSSHGKQGEAFRDHRQVVEAITYLYRTGSPGVMCLRTSGRGRRWKRHRRLAGDGNYDRILAALLADADAPGLNDWEVSVASTVTRAHQHGTTLTRAEQVTGGVGELQELGRGAA